MKTFFVIALLTLFVSACRNNDTTLNKNIQKSKVLYDGSDTLNIIRSDSSWSVSRKVKNELITKSILFYDDKVLIGLLKDNKLDGRYYVLDNENLIANQLYFVNNQKVYSHNLLRYGDLIIPKREVFQIDSQNVKWIDPPTVVQTICGGKRIGLKATCKNYPLYLTKFYWYPPQSFTYMRADSIRNNYYEESFNFYGELHNDTAVLRCEMKDTHGNLIKRYEWKPEDRYKHNSLFSEVSF